MMWFLFLFGLALAAEPPSNGQELKLVRGGCPLFWFSFDGCCYRYIATLMTWADAEQHCVNQGANLVSIHSLEEEHFVKLLIRNVDPAEGANWIGLSDSQQDGTYFWSDGSRFNFKLWSSGEPNNYGGSESCVHTNWDSYRRWNDKECTDRYAFVCKARPVSLECNSESTQLFKYVDQKILN